MFGGVGGGPCDPRMKRKKKTKGNRGVEEGQQADENTNTPACLRPTAPRGIRVSRFQSYFLCGIHQHDSCAPHTPKTIAGGGGAVPPAHVAQTSARPEDGEKENQACRVRGGEVPGHENKDATCQSERRAIRARSTGGWVTGVRCKQEMICLLSAPSSPACVKDAQRQKLRGKRAFPPQTVLL